MKKQTSKKFTWDLLLLITGVFFLFFSGFLKLINKHGVELFFNIGAINFGTGILVLLYRLLFTHSDYNLLKKIGDKETV